MAELIYRSGSGGEERFALNREVSSIGRDEDCDVILPDTSVSRRHALIYRVDEKLYRVEDNNSSNGTLVNGQRILTEFLRDGDMLEIGCYHLVFSHPAALDRVARPVPADRPLRSAAPAQGPIHAQPDPPRGIPADRPRITPQRSANILVLDSGKVIQEHSIVRDTLTIGAAADNDLVLQDPRVSNEHAQIVFHDGAFFLEDLESQSGTYCNHERIISKELKSGDELSIGRFVLVFEVDDELELPAASPVDDAWAVSTVPAGRRLEPEAPMELGPVESPERSPREVGPSPATPADLATDLKAAAAAAPPAAVKVGEPRPDAASGASRSSRALADTVADLEHPEPGSNRSDTVGESAALVPSIAAAPLPRFMVRFPDGRTRELVLDKEQLTLGRLPSNDLVLDDDSISRVHAKVSVLNGKVTIQDQESLNGVQVSGQFVDRAELRHGDLLVLGEIRIEFKDESARGPKPRPPAGRDAYPETIYDAAPQPSSVRDGETLGGEPAQDDSFRRVDDDSFRAADQGIRQAETLYEEPSVFALASEEAAGPLDKLRVVYERLGPSPKQRQLRATLGALILLGLLAILLVEPAPPPTPARSPEAAGQAVATQGPQVDSLVAGQSEAARLARINRVQEAAEAMETQDWNRALARVESVLLEEPSNVKALSIRETARQELEVQARLESAQSLFSEGRPDEAVELLRTVPPQSVYYSKAEALRTDGARKQADKFVAEAERLRDARKFVEAEELARRALQLVPDHSPAASLQRELERRRSAPQRVEPSAEEQAAEARRAQERQAARQEEARAAAQATLDRALSLYAGGDAEAALAALEQVSSTLPEEELAVQHAQGRAELIRAVLQHLRSAQAAGQRGDSGAALREWRSVLEADRALLGAGRQSRFRQDAAFPFAQLLTSQGDELYAAGEPTGEFAPAFEKYSEALAYVPQHGPARAKLSAIEKSAIDQYRLAYGRWETDPEGALNHLEAVLRMLPPTHEYARRAQGLRDRIRSR
jgi:pSer/pThr/pTyr-binding forkhead associated (FHA) protein/tetratricopeptide (TPR) repeat protein